MHIHSILSVFVITTQITETHNTHIYTKENEEHLTELSEILFSASAFGFSLQLNSEQNGSHIPLNI